MSFLDPQCAQCGNPLGEPSIEVLWMSSGTILCGTITRIHERCFDPMLHERVGPRRYETTGTITDLRTGDTVDVTYTVTATNPEQAMEKIQRVLRSIARDGAHIRLTR